VKSYQEIVEAAKIANDSARWWQEKLKRKEQHLCKIFHGAARSSEAIFEKCLIDYQYLAKRVELEEKNITKIQKEIDNYGTQEEL